jgi:uncharacterized protein YbaP (TraB family)
MIAPGIPRQKSIARAAALAVLIGAICLSQGVRSVAAEPAMWVVHGPAGSAVLYGTDHGVAPSPEWDTPKLTAAFERSGELWTEQADPVAAPGASNASPLASFLEPPGRTLPEELSPEDQRLLSDTEQQLKIDPAFMSRFRPAAAAALIKEISYTRAGVPVGVGVETVLKEWARARGLPIKALELANPALLDEILSPPENVGIDDLREAARDFRHIAERRSQTIKIWESADLTAFARTCERGMTPKLHEDVVTSRNRTFARRIAERLNAPGAIFVAVGACHLVGQDNLIPMLLASGLTVERQ